MKQTNTMWSNHGLRKSKWNKIQTRKKKKYSEIHINSTLFSIVEIHFVVKDEQAKNMRFQFGMLELSLPFLPHSIYSTQPYGMLAKCTFSLFFCMLLCSVRRWASTAFLLLFHFEFFYEWICAATIGKRIRSFWHCYTFFERIR